MIKRWKKTFASLAMTAGIAAAAYLSWNAPASSGGETRTISIYHIHTKENLKVTYKKDGKYIPSAMKKINYILRDWRRNEVITISPRTIDLMWELHEDLGSKQPVHIVSGYRSPKTNAFLKSMGRNVARKSQHMVGKAIDIYFPDVPTKKMRNSALVRQVGGVGYYRSGGGPTGFLHIDSGRVRHWGPAISQREMASIMRDYRKTVGARGKRKGAEPQEVEVAEAEADPTAAGLPSQQEVAEQSADSKNRKKIPLETAYSDDDEELAGMSEDASAAPKKPKTKPEDEPGQPEVVAEAPEGVTQGYPVPRPRPKPIEVLMMAAVNMNIEPASAPPPDQMARNKPAPLADSTIGFVPAAGTMAEIDEPQSNTAAKTSLAEELRNGQTDDVPVIRSMATASAGGDVFWWPNKVIFDPNKAVRRDGAAQQFSDSPLTDLLPGVSAAQAEPAGNAQQLAVSEPAQVTSTEGKGDMLVVNREGKGSLLSPPALRRTVENQN